MSLLLSHARQRARQRVHNGFFSPPVVAIVSHLSFDFSTYAVKELFPAGNGALATATCPFKCIRVRETTCLIIGAVKRRYIYWRCASIVSGGIRCTRPPDILLKINDLPTRDAFKDNQALSIMHFMRLARALHTERGWYLARKLNPRKITTNGRATFIWRRNWNATVCDVYRIIMRVCTTKFNVSVKSLLTSGLLSLLDYILCDTFVAYNITDITRIPYYCSEWKLHVSRVMRERKLHIIFKKVLGNRQTVRGAWKCVSFNGNIFKSSEAVFSLARRWFETQFNGGN